MRAGLLVATLLSASHLAAGERLPELERATFAVG
jgi:hypothetical protein